MNPPEAAAGRRKQCATCLADTLIDNLAQTHAVYHIETAGGGGKCLAKLVAVCGNCAIACAGCSASIGATAREHGSLCYMCFTARNGGRCCVECYKPTKGQYLRCWGCKK